MITGNGLNIPIAGFANSLEGFQQADDRAVKRRSEIRKDMMELADMAANQGIQIGMDDWAQMAASQMRSGDFLASTAPSSDVLNIMRTAQNTKAVKADEDRQRQTFRAQLEDDKLVEDEIQKRSLSGETNEEIAVGLRDSFGARADKFIPRVAAVTNQAILNERLKTEQAYADTFEDEDQARTFIASNPGFTKAAQEGLLNAGRKAALRKEDNIHKVAVDVAAKIGSEVGANTEQQVRTLVDAFTPPSTKPEVRQRIVEKAWEIAKASQDASLSSTQFKTSNQAGLTLAQNAPQTAAAITQFQIQENERTAKAQEQFVARGQASIAQTDALLKDLRANAVKLKDTKEEKYLEHASTIASTYVISDLDGLLEAIRKGDNAKIERIKAASPTRIEEQSRLTSGAAFLKGPAFSSQGEMLAGLERVLPNDKHATSVGAGYKAQLDLSSPSGVSSTPKPPADSKVINGKVMTSSVSWNPNTGAPEVEWKEWQPSSTPVDVTKEREAAATQAAIIREKFVDDMATKVLAGVNSTIAESGRINMTPEEMTSVARNVARRYVSSFLRGAGLTGAVGKDSVDAMTEEVMGRMVPPTGASVRENPVTTFQKNLTTIAGGNGLAPTSYTVPGAAMPSPRLGQQGVPQSNQWWNPR